MKYTADEVIQFVEEENVKFIRLAFCDIYGRQKNISIMPGELRRADAFQADLHTAGASIRAGPVCPAGAPSENGGEACLY